MNKKDPRKKFKPRHKEIRKEPAVLNQKAGPLKSKRNRLKEEALEKAEDEDSDIIFEDTLDEPVLPENL